MDFADEHYVKLYTRDTATRLMWPWQAIALHPNLLRKVDKAGILELGELEPLRSLAVVVGLPIDVVKPGLDALLEDGTVELSDGVLVVPRFVDGQEARKTRAVVARDHREKKRDLARAKRSGLLEHIVTSRDHAEPRVTSSDPPSPARPLPDPVPSQTPTSAQSPVAVAASVATVVRPPPVPPAVDDPFESGPAYWATVQRRRYAEGGVVERPPDPRALSTWWSEVGMELNGRYELLDPALARFGSNKHWENSDPPWPFPAFMKTWRNYVRR